MTALGGFIESYVLMYCDDAVDVIQCDFRMASYPSHFPMVAESIQLFNFTRERKIGLKPRGDRGFPASAKSHDQPDATCFPTS